MCVKTSLSSFLYCLLFHSLFKMRQTASNVIEAESFLEKHFEALPVGMEELPTIALTEPTHASYVRQLSAHLSCSRIIREHACWVDIPLKRHRLQRAQGILPNPSNICYLCVSGTHWDTNILYNGCQWMNETTATSSNSHVQYLENRETSLEKSKAECKH